MITKKLKSNSLTTHYTSQKNFMVTAIQIATGRSHRQKWERVAK